MSGLSKLSRGVEVIGICTIHDIAEGVSGYNYYGYASRNGDYFILRENIAGTEYRYAVKPDKGYVAAWTDKVNLDYKYIFEIV